MPEMYLFVQKHFKSTLFSGRTRSWLSSRHLGDGGGFQRTCLQLSVKECGEPVGCGVWAKAGPVSRGPSNCPAEVPDRKLCSEKPGCTRGTEGVRVCGSVSVPLRNKEMDSMVFGPHRLILRWNVLGLRGRRAAKQAMEFSELHLCAGMPRSSKGVTGPSRLSCLQFSWGDETYT